MTTRKHQFGDAATTRELIDACTSRGVEVTVTRLTRWAKYGLLETPRKRGLGPGKGSVQVWLPGSLERIILIARLLQEGDRSLGFVAQALIADGQWVRPALLRAMLDDIVRTVDKGLQQHAAADTADLEKAIEAARPWLTRIDERSTSAALSVDFGLLKDLTPGSFRQSIAALDDAQLAAAFDDAGHALATITATFNAVLLPFVLMILGVVFAQMERQHKAAAVGPVNVESLRELAAPVPVKAAVRLLLTLWFAKRRAAEPTPISA